jgi:putative nucleotidyltransferase with HDIG domain
MTTCSLNFSQVMSVLLKALDQIDERLVNHGRRVAYIVYKMMRADGSYTEKDMQEICILAALHDIGAYKTEEIDQMMRFESENAYDHSIYGYLFFKYMSPLGKLAEAILYHHFNYASFPARAGNNKDAALMIHLADRMDVLLRNGKPWPDAGEALGQHAAMFGEAMAELFRRADGQFKIEENIKNGAYSDELMNFLSTAEFEEETMLDFIRMIAYAIDFRSEFTASHMIATASISMELGKLFELDREQLKKLRLGACLHDIGKISTPPGILEKNGALTAEEMRIMRKHVETTGRILRGHIPEDIFQIAFRHHEKLDGSGYPCRLRAEQLTLSDRILAVADQISALAGKRSYKEGFPKETVIEILRQQKDEGKLCGRVTDCAIHSYDAIMDSSKKNIGAITEMHSRISEESRLIKKSFKDMEILHSTGNIS